MSYSAGAHVHVASFGKGVVREVRNAGRYLVELKGRSMVVHGSQLTAVNEHKRRRATVVAGESGEVAAHLERLHATASIDLHGMTREEVDGAVDSFLSGAILAGLAEVRVIHGRGSGTLRSAVHERLTTVASVRGFRLDPGNPGVTIVDL